MEERRLRDFDNMILTRILGPERDEVAREWRKQHNEELYDLFFSTNIVRVIESKKKVYIVGAYSAYERQPRFTQGFGGENRGKENTWKTQV
jgi:hypothetical protein